MIKEIEFRAEHLELLVSDSVDFQKVTSLGELNEYAQNMARMGYSSTFICDGRIVMCAGYIELWPGVCEVWVVPSIYLKDYPLAINKEITRYIDALFKAFKYHRIQTVAYDEPKFSRWLSWLGFECEGYLKNYTSDKSNYKIWARFS